MVPTATNRRPERGVLGVFRGLCLLDCTVIIVFNDVDDNLDMVSLLLPCTILDGHLVMEVECQSYGMLLNWALPLPLGSLCSMLAFSSYLVRFGGEG